MADPKYWYVWLRSKETELIEKTIEDALNKFKEKYKSLPDIIECSLKDKQEEFDCLGFKIVPTKGIHKGMIFMTKNEGLSKDILKI